MKLVTVLYLAVGLATAQTCPAWVCDPHGVKWREGVCAIVDSNATQFDIRYCGSSEFCPYNLLGSLHPVIRCAPIFPPVPAPAESAFPGERCDYLHTCYSGDCLSGICSTITPCVNPGDCGLGQFCRNSTCLPLVPFGGACASDFDCVNNAGCDIGIDAQYGMCRELGSLPAGAIVQSCGYSSHYLCASGQCYSLNATAFACTGLFMSPVLPYRCGTTSEDICNSTRDIVSGQIASNGCECGYDGYSYCSLFNGDPDAQAYMSVVTSYMRSPN